MSCIVQYIGEQSLRGTRRKMELWPNSLSCEMCNCRLFMNSHAILTTSSSLNERCVEDEEEAGAVLAAATVSAAVAAVAIVNSFGPRWRSFDR